MNHEPSAARQRRESAEAHVGPIEPECQHAVQIVQNNVATCVRCHGRRLVLVGTWDNVIVGINLPAELQDLADENLSDEEWDAEHPDVLAEQYDSTDVTEVTD